MMTRAEFILVPFFLFGGAPMAGPVGRQGGVRGGALADHPLARPV